MLKCKTSLTDDIPSFMRSNNFMADKRLAKIYLAHYIGLSMITRYTLTLCPMTLHTSWWIFSTYSGTGSKLGEKHQRQDVPLHRQCEASLSLSGVFLHTIPIYYAAGQIHCPTINRLHLTGICASLNQISLTTGKQTTNNKTASHSIIALLL